MKTAMKTAKEIKRKKIESLKRSFESYKKAKENGTLEKIKFSPEQKKITLDAKL